MAAADALQLSDGRGDGCIMGQSSTDPIGFHGKTPVPQRASAVQGTIATTRAVSTGHYGFTSTQANAILDMCNEVSAMLTARGDWKGSA